MIKYKIEQIYSWLYRIQDPLDVYFYLIIGDNKALLFDTGYGVGNIPEIIKTVTNKPLTVILGHAHFDHANGAYQFNEVYLHESDFEKFKLHTSPSHRDVIIKFLSDKGIEPDFDINIWRNNGSCKLIKLDYDTVFDLGSLNVVVINMAGHTSGSIGLLVIEKQVLLNSDSANNYCGLFSDEALAIREYISMLERVYKLDFNTFYTAHNAGAFPKSDFERYIHVAKNITIEKSVPFDVIKEFNPYIYTEDGISIVFSERTLKG